MRRRVSGVAVSSRDRSSRLQLGLCGETLGACCACRRIVNPLFETRGLSDEAGEGGPETNYAVQRRGWPTRLYGRHRRKGRATQPHFRCDTPLVCSFSTAWNHLPFWRMLPKG